jgi:rubredoxin
MPNPAISKLPPTHRRSYEKPAFSNDPFGDDELLCPGCNSNTSLDPCGSASGIGEHGLHVFANLCCKNCDTVFDLAIFKSISGGVFIEWADKITKRIDPEPEPEAKRKTIKPGLRFEILKRDNYRCQMCGVTAKDGATLEIDHIYPVSKGGTNEPDNLQVLCRDCNAGKGAQCQ